MTAPPNNPPQVFASLSDAIQSLRDSGLRLSTARRLVLEALFAAEGPVSAAHLVRTLSLDESSVYRNLDLLEQRGVVRHLHLGHSPGLYVLTSEHEVEYLYCERCAKVAAVSPERLNPIRDRIEANFGYRPRFTHFAIVGVCQDCLREPKLEQPVSQPPGGSASRSAARKPRPTSSTAREQLHSHGDYVHSHPGRARHTH